MPNPYFSFKQFTVYHDRCAMKVGIDGVLLGAWTTVEKSQRILDIGTGTGLIALMLAQRSKAVIDAIDLDDAAVEQARENIGRSPWKERIQVCHQALQEFAQSPKEPYDLIVSNPPYFIQSLKAPEQNRAMARHADTLTHEELILSARSLLADDGRICLILPVAEGRQVIDFACSIGLFCSRLVTVYPKPTTAAKRLLIELCKKSVNCMESQLIIETNERHQYSDEFTAIAKDYYLKL